MTSQHARAAPVTATVLRDPQSRGHSEAPRDLSDDTAAGQS
jgi:hypothetical protein